MKCVICKHGETRAGAATVTLERDGATFVVRGVPARVCDNCGEEYVSERVAARLLRDADLSAEALAKAEVAAKSGTRIQIRQYAAA